MSVRFYGRVIAIILGATRALQYWKTLVRVLCVVAIAAGSISHVAVDFASANAAQAGVVSLEPDTASSSDSTMVVERCHSCCVVSFLIVAAGSCEEVAARAVPDGRLLHLLAFLQSTTAPPPRTLT